jgi:hypothetical protein
MATIGKLFFILLTLIGILAVPAMAGTEYLAGSPNLSAYISGTNEFSPNSDVQLTVIIKNTGINEDKYVQSGIIDRDDLPNTAKFLTVGLSPGKAPVTIKTDPQMIGDVKGASSTSAVFTAKINASAQGGAYTLPLTLNYSYLYRSDQISMDTMQNTYKKEKITLNIPITIKTEVLVDVISAEPEHLNAGTDGYLNLKINNTGSDNGKQAIVKITQNGNSPIIPIDNSIYIGDFPSGKTVSCRYKVSVSEGAEEQTYPVDIAVFYQNAEGDTVTSRTSTVGIPIGGKAEFIIISPPAEMHPGNKKSITVEYKNTGSLPIYSAQSRISAVDPFTSNNDIAYIGTLLPNESRVVSYDISVDRSATVKQYGLDSEIRYRDALDNTYISKPMKVNIEVTAPAGINVILSNPIYLSLLAAVIIGIAYLVFRYRGKKQ